MLSSILNQNFFVSNLLLLPLKLFLHQIEKLLRLLLLCVVIIIIIAAAVVFLTVLNYYYFRVAMTKSSQHVLVRYFSTLMTRFFAFLLLVLDLNVIKFTRREPTNHVSLAETAKGIWKVNNSFRI